MHAHEIALGLDPAYLGEREPPPLGANLDPETGVRGGQGAAFELGQPRLEESKPLARPPRLEVASRLVDRGGEAGGAKLICSSGADLVSKWLSLSGVQ